MIHHWNGWNGVDSAGVIFGSFWLYCRKVWYSWDMYTTLSYGHVSVAGAGAGAGTGISSDSDTYFWEYLTRSARMGETSMNKIQQLVYQYFQ